MKTLLYKSGVLLSFFALLAPLLLPVQAQAAVSGWVYKGASFIPQSTTDFGSGDFQQSVRNFKAAGGNTVNFIVPYYQSNSGATDINAGWNTPSDSSLISGIQYVHSLGMKAEISIYLENYNGEWRANINPGDRNTWYQKYGDVLVHYGQLGQAQGVELYQLGAELVDMASASQNGDNTQRWVGMINRVRAVYKGALTYSANRGQQGWASELPNIQFWDKLDYIGVSAYYDFNTDNSVASLKSQWQNVNNYDIAPIAQRWNKPIIFAEVGYRSVTNAHIHPWDSGMGGGYDAQEQVNDYEALFQYWNDYSTVQGMTLWWWSPNPNYGGSGNTDYTPQNKPAQDTIKKWWTGAVQPPPNNPPPNNPPPTNPPPTSGSTSIWWPVPNVHIGGLQPFKALVENTDTSQYDMFWQVDNGGQVPMYTSTDGWPHKEAMVDFTGWNWKGSAPYTITFTSKNKSGTTISTKSVQIYTP